MTKFGTKCKWRHLVTKFGTNADGAIWWPNLKPIQEVPLWTVLTERFTQDMKSIPWVRCASGNVLQIGSKFGHCVTFLVTLPWNAFLTSTWHIHISFKFGHQLVPLTYLATKWHHLHELQSWPPDGVTCISYKVGHLMALLALVPNLTTWWHHSH